MKFITYIFLVISLFTEIKISAQVKIWTLKDCINQAWDNNIQLNQSELSNKIDKINLDLSKASVYPNLSFGDNHNFNFGNSINPSTYQTTKQTYSSNSLSLNSNITIFNGFQNVNLIKQNKLSYEAGKFDVDKLKNDITLGVISAYLQVIYSYEALDIAKNQMEATSKQVEKTQKYVDAGKLAEGSLFQIQYQYSQDKTSVVNAENQLQLAKVSLMQLMEMPITNDFDVDKVAITEPIIENNSPTSDIYKTSESIMPEIKSAELKTKASEIGIKVAQSNEMPKLTLGGTLKSSYLSNRYLYSSQTTYNTEDIGYLQSNPLDRVIGLIPTTTITKGNYSIGSQFKDNFGQVLGLSLTIPIFSNFQAKYGVDKAKINLLNAKLNEQATKNQLRKSIEQAYTDLAAAAKNYASVEDGFKSEEKAYNDMEKKYNLGIATATDFLIEKNNCEKAMFSVVQAKFNYIFKSKIVDFYLGKPLN